MASKSITIQARDRNILNDLLQSPYDASQLRKISDTYDQPFTDEHFVRRRMRKLRDGDYISIHNYLTDLSGQLKYYKLTPKGYRFVCGADKPLPPRSYFSVVSPSLQQHTQRLADLLAHTRWTAYQSKIKLPFLLGDNQVRLKIGSDTLIPDGAFGLKAKSRTPRHYLIELDCGTEPVCSDKQRDSLAKKLRLYYSHEAASQSTYRVLFVFNSATPRLHRFLELARELAPDPRRHIVMATLLERYLDHGDPLRYPIFMDHDGKLVSLLPSDSEGKHLVRNTMLDELVPA